MDYTGVVTGNWDTARKYAQLRTFLSVVTKAAPLEEFLLEKFTFVPHIASTQARLWAISCMFLAGLPLLIQI